MGSGLWTAGRPGWGGAEQGAGQDWGAGQGGRGGAQRSDGGALAPVPPPCTGSRWRAPGWPCPWWRSLAGAGQGQVQVRPALTFSSGETSCSLVVWPKPHALPPRPEGAPRRPVAALSVRTWEHTLLLHQPWGPWAGPEQGGLRPHPPVPAQGGCAVPLSTTRPGVLGTKHLPEVSGLRSVAPVSPSVLQPLTLVSPQRLSSVTLRLPTWWGHSSTPCHRVDP